MPCRNILAVLWILFVCTPIPRASAMPLVLPQEQEPTTREAARPTPPTVVDEWNLAADFAKVRQQWEPLAEILALLKKVRIAWQELGKKQDRLQDCAGRFPHPAFGPLDSVEWVRQSFGKSLSAASFPRDPLVHTYSIVARDPVTGDFGVAVQSHWFQVGKIVPWALSGVGAVATQSFVEPSYGALGLELMAKGKSAQEALDLLLAKDEQRDVRQVAMVDSKGNVAAWTGKSCIQAAGNRKGKGYSVQANLMDRDTVWDAMARAYEGERNAALPFGERLLAALEAAEREGGDIRGRQSAALLIVRSEPTEAPWNDRIVDLRIADHEEPLAELRRLWNLHRAYEAMNLGDEAMSRSEIDAAVAHYSRAASLAPDIVEIPFWQAVTLFTSGETERALVIFADVFRREERWARLVPRLPASGLLPEEAVEKILKVSRN